MKNRLENEVERENQNRDWVGIGGSAFLTLIASSLAVYGTINESKSLIFVGGMLTYAGLHNLMDSISNRY